MFPEKNSYAETIEVVGREKDVDAAIEELSQTSQKLNGRDTAEVRINCYIIYEMEEETSKQVVRELSEKYDVHIQVNFWTLTKAKKATASKPKYGVANSN